VEQLKISKNKLFPKIIVKIFGGFKKKLYLCIRNQETKISTLTRGGWYLIQYLYVL
jgi:hypothetical protein